MAAGLLDCWTAGLLDCWTADGQDCFLRQNRDVVSDPEYDVHVVLGDDEIDSPRPDRGFLSPRGQSLPD
jgi:hypothetical protein